MSQCQPHEGRALVWLVHLCTPSLTDMYGAQHLLVSRMDALGHLLFLFVLWFDPHFGKPTCDAWFLEIKVCDSFLLSSSPFLTSVGFPWLIRTSPLEEEVYGGWGRDNCIRDRTFLLQGLKRGNLHQIPNTVLRWDGESRPCYSDCFSPPLSTGVRGESG